MDEKLLVVVTEPISPPALGLLRRAARVHQLDLPSEEELAEAVAEADALFNKTADTRITERILRAGRQLRIVARHGVGYDNVDVAAATRLGIVVTNTPGSNANAVAEFTFAAMLVLSRKLIPATRSVSEGEWVRTRFLGFDLAGKTLGVIGMGDIGRRVARMASCFGMRVVYFSRHAGPDMAAAVGGTPAASLEELLSQADVVTLHTSLTPDTAGMIDERRLGLMKPTALLIDTARGGIVDEDALYRALAEKRLAGAAMDVFAKEPLGMESALRRLDNVILTPHIASMTGDAQTQTAVMAAEEICLVLSGNRPRYPVNREVLERRP